MSFNSHRRSIGFIVLFAAGALGCGHKADPFPPPLENPSRTANLTAQQRGQAAVLSFSYPQTTVSGTLLGPLEKVEVYRTKRDLAAVLGPAPEEEVPGDDGGEEQAQIEPPDANGEDTELVDADGEATPEDESALGLPAPSLETLAAAAPNEFTATAQLVETFDADAIEQATQGDQLTFRIELGEAEHETTAHTFAVKTYASEGLASAFSNLATLVQRDVPAPPTDFQLTADADGIRLAWSNSPEVEEPIAFRVYRRSAQSRIYGPPLTRLPGTESEYLDRSAEFGERYIYAVTALGNENPVVESFFGGEREIDYADRFAPSAPSDLIALAEAGRVRLLWDASPEDDVVGYVIFRRPGGGDFRRLTDEPVVDVEYSDRSVEGGTTYDYRVAAIDRSGNLGEPGDSVVARVP